MPDFHRLALSAALLAAGTAFAAEVVYRTVGPDGSVIYSDTPSPDAEKLIIEDVQTVDSVPPPPNFVPAPGPDVSLYSSVSFTTPQNDETLRPGGDTIAVSVAVAPQYDSKDSIVLYLDGAEYASGISTSFSLANVERGTHQLRAEVRAPDGKVLVSSETIAIHVHQPIAAPKSTTPPPKPGSNPPKPTKTGN